MGSGAGPKGQANREEMKINKTWRNKRRIAVQIDSEYDVAGGISLVRVDRGSRVLRVDWFNPDGSRYKDYQFYSAQWVLGLAEAAKLGGNELGHNPLIGGPSPLLEALRMLVAIEEMPEAFDRATCHHAYMKAKEAIAMAEAGKD